MASFPAKFIAKTLFLTLLASYLGGCVTQEAMIDGLPVVDAVSRPNDSLRRVPPPAKKTTVAVYSYNDLTGQYKERELVQTLSRAVTQGGASILIKALQDAGERRWFTVLDRSKLDSLLKERQIVTEMRRLYRNETRVNAGVLPPLKHASILIEGGIIGYDSNVQTGGAGARYLGIGGDTKYLRDVVTVTLRAISTKTGEVLATVTVRKAVASYSLQSGAFLFVKLDRIFEAEAGVTYNEPKQIAVQSAIEKAVESLIIEGVENGIWKFDDRSAGQEYVEAFRREEYGDKITVAAVTPVPNETKNPTELMQTAAYRPVPAVGQTRNTPTVRTEKIKPQKPNSDSVGATERNPNVRVTVPSPYGAPEKPEPKLPPKPAKDEEAIGFNLRDPIFVNDALSGRG